MGAQDHGCVVLEQILDGGQRSVDARLIGNIQICVQRDIKVAADEHFLAGNLDIFNGHFVQIHFRSLLKQDCDYILPHNSTK